jgi:ABC-type transport system involved in multi-copper enzyme maturation permease subunit
MGVIVMKVSKPMKGLLEKEWRHNRGYFLTTLLIIIYAPVIKTMFHLFRGGANIEQWLQELNYALTFGVGMAHPPVYSGLLQWIPALGALLLGVIILGEERKGGLNYLVSTPVSRWQIILAKFFPGAGVVILSMLVNGLFLVGLGSFQPVSYNTINVFNWCLLTGATCLCIFTAALMVSTFTSGVLAAGVVCYFLNVLPGMVMAMIEHIGARYFALAESVSIKLCKLGSYLTMSDYINHSERHITSLKHDNNWITSCVSSTGGLGPDYLLDSCILLAGVLLFLILAIIIFERFSLQTGGTIFATGSARKTALAVGVLIISFWLVFPRVETLLKFILYYSLLTGLFYTGSQYLYRLLRYGWQLPGRKKKVSF